MKEGKLTICPLPHIHVLYSSGILSLSHCKRENPLTLDLCLQKCHRLVGACRKWLRINRNKTLLSIYCKNAILRDILSGWVKNDPHSSHIKTSVGQPFSSFKATVSPVAAVQVWTCYISWFVTAVRAKYLCPTCGLHGKRLACSDDFLF